MRCGALVSWLCLGFAVTPTGVHAQEKAGAQGALPIVRFDLVVTPERAETLRRDVPAAVDVLTRDDIETLPAESGAEALQALPALRVLFCAPGQVPVVSARGFFGGGEAEYVQLRIDGIPLGSVESALGDWAFLRSTDVSRIETLRGPASALYGDTAIGGTVQIFTTPRVPQSTVVGGAGSWSTASLDTSTGWQLGRAHFNASAGYLRTDGYASHARASQAQGRGRADLPVSWGMWSTHGAFWWRDRQEPGPRSMPELREDRFGSSGMFAADGEEARKGYVAVTFKHVRDDTSFQFTGHGTRRRAHQTRTVLLIPDFGVRAVRQSATSSFGASAEVAAGGGRLAWRAGGEAVYETLDSRYPDTGLGDGALSPPTTAAGRRGRLASFAALVWTVGARVRIVPAVRYDRTSDIFTAPEAEATQDAWSPRLSASVLVGSARRPVTLFGQVSRAFKAATLDQLFDPRPLPDFRGGTFTLSNRALEPQRATNVEAGAFQSAGALAWQAVAYRMQVENEIDFDLATFAYRNIGRSRHAGAEVDLAWRKWSTFVPRAAYAWTRVRPVAGAGEEVGQLKNIPAHRWHAGITSRVRGTSVTVRFTRSSGAFMDDQNRVPLAGEAGVDARVARRFGRLRLNVDVINMFDRRTDGYGFVLDGFGGGVPYVYPSPPRLVRAAVEWRF